MNLLSRGDARRKAVPSLCANCALPIGGVEWRCGLNPLHPERCIAIAVVNFQDGRTTSKGQGEARGTRTGQNACHSYHFLSRAGLGAGEKH
jgi:hypothetical protein